MTNPRQCPTCKRVFREWDLPNSRRTIRSGSKGRQLDSRFDRVADYRAWRWGLGHKLYCSDVDFLEWRHVNGTVRPAGIIELTRVDGAERLPDTYLESIIKRIFIRDAQGVVIRSVALALGVPLFVVAFRHDLSEFWVWDGYRWDYKMRDAYEYWLRRLQPIVDWDGLMYRGVSEILWSSQNAVIYKDMDGKVWRYMPRYNAEWPIVVDK